MKKIVFLLFIVLFVASCNSGGYKIEGSYPSAADGTIVYMVNPNEELENEESAVVKNGKFSFKGGLYDRSVRMLWVESEMKGGPVVLEPGVISVKIDKDVVRGGTDGNEILQRFVEANEHLVYLEQMTSTSFIRKIGIGQAMLDSLIEVRDTARNNFMEYSQLAIEKNIDNGLGLFILSKVYQRMDVVYLADILSRVPLYLRSSRYDVINSYAQHRLAAAKRKMATAVGQQYQNFELSDLNDKKVLFSNIVDNGKYTLLQFWASWCAPCRAELPAIEALHAKYKKNGFSVVGLSLDSNTQECRSAVSSMKLSFMQLCAPVNGCSEVATAYGVDAIPANLLINDNGTILARNLSPAELDKILGEALH